jgi:hypothetical protein
LNSIHFWMVWLKYVAEDRSGISQYESPLLSLSRFSLKNIIQRSCHAMFLQF